MVFFECNDTIFRVILHQLADKAFAEHHDHEAGNPVSRIDIARIGRLAAEAVAGKLQDCEGDGC
jgi:hypothetical protein